MGAHARVEQERRSVAEERRAVEATAEWQNSTRSRIQIVCAFLIAFVAFQIFIIAREAGLTGDGAPILESMTRDFQSVYNYIQQLAANLRQELSTNFNDHISP